MGSYTLKVAAPTLAPGTGSYTSAETVTVTTATPGAVLHYTLDGKEPTESGPVVVSGATVVMSQSGTLMVKGWRAGWTTSDTASAVYTISLGTVAAEKERGLKTLALVPAEPADLGIVLNIDQTGRIRGVTAAP